VLDGKFRDQIETWVKPVGKSMRRAGINADVVTVIGLVMAVACAVSIGMGALRVGLLFLVLTGIPDLIDGAIAKASGTESDRGAFLDSVTDRLTDGLLFGGVAWYLTTVSDGPLAVLPFAVFLSASMVSYIRAKGDALGYDARGGLIERAERFIILGFGLFFDDLLVATMWILLVLNSITAGQRFVSVWRQASAAKPQVTTTSKRRRTNRSNSQTAAERWRSRRLEARRRSEARRSDRH
jgi:CDP-diacylglycerol--glycerol-3-phosphate 3-phosphatidyltransferase